MHKKQLLVYIFGQKMCKIDFMTSITDRGRTELQNKSFGTLFKLNWNKFKLEYYNFRMLNVI